jgi:molecular chaperone HtpG
MSKMYDAFTRDPKSPQIEEYSELLYGQALLAEGGQLPDPAGFNRKIAELMAGAL